MPVFENPVKASIAPITIIVCDGNLLKNVSIPILWLVLKVSSRSFVVIKIGSVVVDMVVGAVLENEAEKLMIANCDLGVSEFADFDLHIKTHDFEVSGTHFG